MAKITSIKRVESTFDDVKQWYETKLSPSVINFEDPKPYEVYQQARWAGIFQLTSPGAQRLFVKAQPKNIIDIATLTSIYRPGPLAAKVDDLYLKARDGDQIDWGDDRINEILSQTKGCLIFQEQVMLLAEKCAGFPKDKCDEVRRAIMKLIGAAAEKAKKEIRDPFINGCIANGYTAQVANNLFDKILFFAGYGFNKAHAVAYAIDSFWCSWLMTYYEEQWLSAYLESMSNAPEKRSKAFGEVKQLGYSIIPIDINYATASWSVLPGKKFMPSFLSCKGIGGHAIDEIEENRPYKTIESLLWNDDGTWRHSKFNKRSLESLIKIGAFESMDLVGEGKLFNSYHHMHQVIIEYGALIKKTSKKDPHIGRKNFYELIRKLAPEVSEWSRQELSEFHVDLFGNLDVSMLIDPKIVERLEQKGVPCIDDYEEKGLHWFVIKNTIAKKTKTNKDYLLIEAVGMAGQSYRMNMWGWKPQNTYEPFSVCVAELDKNEFGFATTAWKIKVL